MAEIGKNLSKDVQNQSKNPKSVGVTLKILFISKIIVLNLSESRMIFGIGLLITINRIN